MAEANSTSELTALKRGERPTTTGGSQTAWMERCDYWAHQFRPTKSDRRRKHPDRPLLVLTGHGASIRMERGTLLVRDGLTHHPQERKEWRFFPGEWRVPSRIVMLDCSGAITFDALKWLSEQRVPLAQINWRGEAINVIGLSSIRDPRLIEAQRLAKASRKGVEIARRLIAVKIENSIETLSACLADCTSRRAALALLEKCLIEIASKRISNISAILGVEGRAAAAYFKAIEGYPLRWKGAMRRPIPQDWKSAASRLSKATSKNHRNRHATHPMNAMLNYAYGVLQSRVHQYVAGAGFDPEIGFLHGNDEGKAALVYDLMEPMRPIADRAVLKFVDRHEFEPQDFGLSQLGVCRLNPQLARAVLKSITDQMTAAKEFDRLRGKEFHLLTRDL